MNPEMLKQIAEMLTADQKPLTPEEQYRKDTVEKFQNAYWDKAETLTFDAKEIQELGNWLDNFFGTHVPSEKEKLVVDAMKNINL